ncbi:expressed unknown protein [Seminavis robusta]|uniref:Uncharacterized protein n=1 Tax=Seminavis robusta TaxID=568900 RepID=A0A9N8F3I8_9STRA|nr:expressed unknown protein [Seminavis robusta]|eukprot:Sro2725_g335620.1 n/a (240) ;mRNA; f:6026-6745
MKSLNLPSVLAGSLAAVAALPPVSIDAFIVPKTTSVCLPQTAISRVHRPWILPATNDGTNDDDDDGVSRDTTESITSSLRPSNDIGATNDSIQSSSVATMMSQENKRILIEELGYRRKDAERLRLELVSSIVEKRLKCPTEGIPEEWCRSEQELTRESRMMQRLEQESQYPLKLPLIGISLILFGKGFGDALITIIKVNMDFPGASLAEQFLGVPVLGIDMLCVVLGGALGWWTWKTMK